MREPPPPITSALPRPGRALKGVLAVIALFAVAGELLQAWGPKGVFGSVVEWLAFFPGQPQHAWTFLTSGLLTATFTHALWSLLGLYFLTPDLERRWGAARLLRFLGLSVVIGNLFVLAVSKLPFGPEMFHPDFVIGPTAMIGATSIAWAKENRLAQIRFFFFFPMTGRTLYWATLGLAAASIVFRWAPPEGVVAPLAGALAGVLLSGTPSPMRSAWLRVKLGLLRRRGESLKADAPSSSDRPRTKRGGKGPPLRIVYGGLEEDLKNRKPPKDKRYLN